MTASIIFGDTLATLARVLLLGGGGVGKTTLIKRFQSPASFEEEELVTYSSNSYTAEKCAKEDFFENLCLIHSKLLHFGACIALSDADIANISFQIIKETFISV